MARIISISKYPPLEGGISAKTYWLARVLGQKGHYIHIVTDRDGIDPLYSIPNCKSDLDLQNVTVHRVPEDCPWTIPSVEQSSLSLLDKALQVIESNNCDIIEGSYLVPYGIVAWMASKVTGLPLVLRHGGSDIGKFVEAGIWNNIWRRTFPDAATVISDYKNEPKLSALVKNIQVLPPYVPDPSVFKPTEREDMDKPVLALVGKANYHWRQKGWHHVIDIWSQLGDAFHFLVVCQGRGEKQFRDYVEEKMGKGRVSWKKFVAPWQMPELLINIDVLFSFDKDFPFAMFSNIALEALSCGVCLITDRIDFIKYYERFGINLEGADDLLLAVSTSNLPEAIAMVKEFLFKRKRLIQQPINEYSYLSYVEKNEEIILSLCRENNKII